MSQKRAAELYGYWKEDLKFFLSLSLYIGRIWANKCSETNMPDFSLPDTGQKALQVIGVKTQRILPNPAMYDYCRDTF